MKKITAKDLTKQQRIFADTYLADPELNGCQAYLKAYPRSSVKAAESGASRLLSHAKVGRYVIDSLNERSERTKIDADYVLKRIAEIDQMDVLDILNDDHTLKQLSEWPKVWRTSISGIEVNEMFDYATGEKELSGLLKKIKWPDKVKNLELLGKHVDVQAFKDRVGLDLEQDVTPWASIESSIDG